jgi:hypothetical protein
VRANATRFLALGLTVIFLVLALQRVDLSGLIDELKSVNYDWLLQSAACTLVGYMLRTVRWQVRFQAFVDGLAPLRRRGVLLGATLLSPGVCGRAALALFVMSHAIQFAVVTGLGLLFFAREQLSPRDLRPALAAEQAS